MSTLCKNNLNAFTLGTECLQLCTACVTHLDNMTSFNEDMWQNDELKHPCTLPVLYNKAVRLPTAAQFSRPRPPGLFHSPTGFNGPAADRQESLRV